MKKILVAALLSSSLLSGLSLAAETTNANPVQTPNQDEVAPTTPAEGTEQKPENMDAQEQKPSSFLRLEPVAQFAAADPKTMPASPAPAAAPAPSSAPAPQDVAPATQNTSFEVQPGSLTIQADGSLVGYATFKNNTAAPLEIKEVKATTPGAFKVTVRKKDETSGQHAPVSNIVLLSGGTLDLQGEGMDILLSEFQTAPAAGSKLDLTVVFSEAGKDSETSLQLEVSQAPTK